MKRGKTYTALMEKIERDRLYGPLEAVRLLKENKRTKFDETLDLAVRLGIDPKQADQQVRGAVPLPHGTGQTVRVAVFAQGEKAKEAEQAGADLVGGEDLAKRVEQGKIEFDVAVATPDMMGQVGKLGKILGPKGLMPNPKSGTVTSDITKAVKEVKAGKVSYRADKFGIVHLGIGKLSFSEKDLVENYAAVMDELLRIKPAGAKGRYMKTVTLSSTMGPGIKVDPAKLKNLLAEESK